MALNIPRSSEKIAVNAVVHGYVQGVGFRYAVFHYARRVNLVGWVRNQANGTVELHGEGIPAALEELHGWLKRGGPPLARVDRIEWTQVELQYYSEFRVR